MVGTYVCQHIHDVCLVPHVASTRVLCVQGVATTIPHGMETFQSVELASAWLRAAMKRPAAKPRGRPAALRWPCGREGAGPPAKKGVAKDYVLRLQERVEKKVSREKFCTRIRDWAKNLVPGHTIRLALTKNEKRPRPDRYYYRFRCLTCQSCGWCGTASFDKGALQIKALDNSLHGGFNATYGQRGGLTMDQRECVRSYLRECPTYKLQNLMQRLRALGDSLPPERTVATYVHNVRRRDEEAGIIVFRHTDVEQFLFFVKRKCVAQTV